MDYQQLMLFMQKLPTGKWRNQEIESLQHQEIRYFAQWNGSKIDQAVGCAVGEEKVDISISLYVYIYIIYTHICYTV